MSGQMSHKAALQYPSFYVFAQDVWVGNVKTLIAGV